MYYTNKKSNAFIVFQVLCTFFISGKVIFMVVLFETFSRIWLCMGYIIK